MKLKIAAAASLACAAAASLALAANYVSPDPLVKQARALYGPVPAANPALSTSSGRAQVKLGKMLFHDPRLSKSGVISCNTCHNLATYGVDSLPTSLGHGFVVGPRNSPTVFNAALHSRQFWDGRAKDVEEQALGPILNPKEMAMPASQAVIDRIVTIPEYVALFKAAFPGQKQPVNYPNVGRAIGAFERTLLTPSRFDRFLRGETAALTVREKRGLKRFLDIGCAGCHSGPAMGGMVFQKFELPNRQGGGDLGRYELTKDPKDRYVFKAYSLRNIARTYPYFHDGSVWDLGEAVRLMAKIQHERDLTKSEVGDITAFLGSLTGAIPDDALKLPVLPPSRPDTPRPSL
jgi:cytochrome c peroxidase